jgi:hypothetical protein
MKDVVVIVAKIGEVVAIQLELNIINVKNVIINMVNQVIIQKIIKGNNLFIMFIRFTMSCK